MARMRPPAGGCRAAAALLALAVAGTVAAPAQATKWRKADRLGKPPIEDNCVDRRDIPPNGCYHAVRRTTFEVSRHIVHRGETFSATAESGWREWSPVLRGTGVRVLSISRTDNGFTARLRATRETDGWTWRGFGVRIAVPGSRVFVDEDYYAVVDRRQAVLDGHLLDEDGAGVSGAEMLIVGAAGRVRGDRYRATTGDDGYYHALLRPGRYRVCPRGLDARGRPSGPRRCGPAELFAPRAATRTLRRGKTVAADFKLRLGARVDVSFAPPVLPANGVGATVLTIRATGPFGTPLARERVEIRPNVRGGVAANLAVPAVVCARGRVLWPDENWRDPTADTTTTTLGFEHATDRDGRIDLLVFGGTVPGTWSLSAELSGRSGPLRFDREELQLSPEPPEAYAVLDERYEEIRRAGGQPQIDDDLRRDRILPALIALRREPWWRGVEFAPVDPSTQGARPSILLYPQTTPPAVGPAPEREVVGGGDARVIEATTADIVVAAMGGFPRTLPLELTFGEWLAGEGIPPRAPARIRDRRTIDDDLTYYGFPYPSPEYEQSC